MASSTLLFPAQPSRVDKGKGSGIFNRGICITGGPRDIRDDAAVFSRNLLTREDFPTFGLSDYGNL